MHRGASQTYGNGATLTPRSSAGVTPRHRGGVPGNKARDAAEAIWMGIEGSSSKDVQLRRCAQQTVCI